MKIPDLHRFPPGSFPSPYGHVHEWHHAGEKFGYFGLPLDAQLLAVGWLGAEVESSGPTPDSVLELLFQAYGRATWFGDGMNGAHACEICLAQGARPVEEVIVRWRGHESRQYVHGHRFVRKGLSVYMCPQSLLHYVVDHGYRPPDEFCDAVLTGAFLTKGDLVFIEAEPPPRGERPMTQATAYKDCQSCGMPLKRDPKGGGTEADGSKSVMYCSHCYESGRWTMPDLAKDQMQERVRGKLKEMGLPGFLAGMMSRKIPQLKRWSQARSR